MKVLQICNLPPPYGGAEVFSKQLSRQLSLKGVKIAVLTQTRFEIQLAPGLDPMIYPYSPTFHEDLSGLGVPVHPVFETSYRCGPMTARSPRPDGETVQVLTECIGRVRPDIIHSHSTVAILGEIVKAAEDTGVPVVMTTHGMTTIDPDSSSNVTGGLDSPTILSLFLRCARVVVLSDEAVDFCRRRGGLAVTKISTGVDRDFFSPGGRRRKSGVLYVGKANHQKGLKTVLEAVLAICEGSTEDLHLVGRGLTRDFFRETRFFLDPESAVKAERLMDEGRIRLYGEVPPRRVRDLYRTNRILVLPSLTEGLPLVILEALSCGMPVIASRVGGIPEVIHEDGNGCLIPKGDAVQLAQALKRTRGVIDPDLEAICRQSTEDYSICRIADHYLDLYRDVLGDGRGA